MVVRVLSIKQGIKLSLFRVSDRLSFWTGSLYKSLKTGVERSTIVVPPFFSSKNPKFMMLVRKKKKKLNTVCKTK